MGLSSALAKSDSIVRPLLVRMKPGYSVKLYSVARKRFIALHGREVPGVEARVPQEFSRILWGIRFRSPIFNAAGMYKNAEGYAFCALAGAGAYLAGTTTAGKRKGNSSGGVALPFAPYPLSGAASNWLGLPNMGHASAAALLATMPRVEGCPVGASVAFEPGAALETAFAGLVEGLELYQKAGVDFIELNESCPNTGGKFHRTAIDTIEPLLERLDELSRRFLRKRRRSLPVIVKFSNDTRPELVPVLLDALCTMGYDGVNFGNTSTNYAACKDGIVRQEQQLFEYFTATYGGGVSGRPLAEKSLALTRAAAQALAVKPSPREFHIIRTGGVESAADIAVSLEAGASLAEWYTGYFERLARNGTKVYDGIYRELTGGKSPK
jgi:dihydroorotate dehydrogenase